MESIDNIFSLKFYFVNFDKANEVPYQGIGYIKKYKVPVNLNLQELYIN